MHTIGLFRLCRPSGINFREFVEAELDGTPDMSYIFAVEIQEMIFRAVRLNVEASCAHFSTQHNRSFDSIKS